jgi:hypothetical protein
MVAGLILVSRDWCWNKFLSIEHDQREWAITTLAEYVQEDDGAPQVLVDAKKAKAEQVAQAKQ